MEHLYSTLKFRSLFQLKSSKQNSDLTCTKDEIDLWVIWEHST